MNRMVLMILKNLWRLPWVYGKLCHYAKHREDYSEEEKYSYMRYIVGCAAKAKCPILPIPYEEFEGMSTVEIAKMVRERIERTICEKAC